MRRRWVQYSIGGFLLGGPGPCWDWLRLKQSDHGVRLHSIDQGVWMVWGAIDAFVVVQLGVAPKATVRSLASLEACCHEREALIVETTCGTRPNECVPDFGWKGGMAT